MFRKREQVQRVQSAIGRGAPDKQPGGQHGGGGTGTGRGRDIRAERFQGEGSVHLRPRESSARKYVRGRSASRRAVRKLVKTSK